MKRLLLTALTLFVSSAALAKPVELLVTPLPGAQAQDFVEIKKSILIQSVEPVFSKNEQESLIKVGRSVLALSIKVLVDSEARAQDLRAWTQRKNLKLAVENNAVAFSMELPRSRSLGISDQFGKKQWAIENTGQSESLSIDDLTSRTIVGRPGEDIGLRDAAPENKDSSRLITIAVLDTGISYDHPDLAGQVVEKAEECKALVAYTKCVKESTANTRVTCDQKYASIDSDKNGYPMDCSGWNTTVKGTTPNVLGNNDASDSNGHGTHVAGIIAALADRTGVRGVLQNVKILPVKVIAASPTEPVRPQNLERFQNSSTPPSPDERELRATTGFGDLIARGVLYAIRSKVHVINMSLGWPAAVESNLMAQMVDLARAQNILVVAAAGNDATDALIRPCVYEGVICVGSHDPDGAMSYFSNYGSGVDISAPGLNILSTYPTNLRSYEFTEAVGYEKKSGTSMATPHVAAALGRLLNAGVSSSEAYARLVVGARAPHSSTIRNAKLAKMYTLSGNLDIAESLRAKPQPVVLPVSKLPVQILWDRKQERVPFQMNLKNHWAESGPVTVTARLLNRGVVSQDARLAIDAWKFPSWKSLETKSLTSELSIQNQRLESELQIELTISADGNETQVRTLQADVRVPLHRDFQDRETQIIMLPTGKSFKDALLRSVTAQDGVALEDYVAINKSGAEWSLSLLRESPADQYTVAGVAKITPPKGELLLIQRVDVNLDGASDYVAIFRGPPPANSKNPVFLFYLFDQSFRPLEIQFGEKRTSLLEYSNAKAVMSGRFQWLALDKIRVPAWVGRGLTPELETPAYDPWNPTPDDPPAYRFYYWSPEGLRSIKAADDDEFLLDLLASSPAQKKAGRLSLLIMRGQNADAKYQVAEVIRGQLQAKKEINMPAYRFLGGAPSQEAIDLSMRRNFAATSFSTESHRGALRMTVLETKEDGSHVGADRIIKSPSEVDSVTKVMGTFLGRERRAVLSQNIYDMQLTDLKTGEIASTSLRRFSFLPQTFFSSVFFPAAIEDSQNPSRDRLPGVYVSSGLGLTQGLEVVTPRYESGRLEALVRPARLRLDAQSGCEAAGNAIAATANRPTQISFFCGDRFIRVPLSY